MFFLKIRVEDGYLIKIISNPLPTQPVIWKTTEKTRRLATTLDAWKTDAALSKREKGIQDSLSLLESPKTKFVDRSTE